jgi:hypothetical protein
VVSSQPAYNNPSSQQLLLQQQQQQQQPWGAADAAVLSRSFGSGPLPAGMQQGAQPAAAGAAPFGYTVDGLPLPYGEQCCMMQLDKILAGGGGMSEESNVISGVDMRLQLHSGVYYL